LRSGDSNKNYLPGLISPIWAPRYAIAESVEWAESQSAHLLDSLPLCVIRVALENFSYVVMT